MPLKKILFILTLFTIQNKTEAQISAIFSDEFPDSTKVRVGLTADYGINASALTAQFVSKFYKGGFIDVDLKDQVLSRTKNMNTIGGDLNYGVYVGIKLDSLCHKQNVSLFFSLRDRAHFDARYSKDFYKVGFYGNSDFRGETANFNDFNLNFLRYQQLQVGLFSSKYDSAARWGIALSFLKGEQYASIFAQKAELFTSEDCQYIDFNTNMQVAKSDTSKKGKQSLT